MFAIFFSALCAWFAFFLPCFSTYKTLSQRPIVEADVERTLMYWSCVGLFVGVEYLVPWLSYFIPFYWEAKTLFFIFLSLPQIQGSTFVYTSYLQPFFAKNEKDIDAGIVSTQSNVLLFAQTRLYALWELLWSVLNKTPAAGQPPSQGNGQQSAAPQQPAISLDAAMGLFKTYGPSLLNSLKPAAASSGSSAPTPPSWTPKASSSSVSTMSSVQSRTPQNEVPPPPFPEPVHM
ncbi:hypothetical protein BT96DRAFT_962922 [Gymnopus androsaceus JB14]|uniref:Protein YOP1 n=1 Tax=Gymnopus androsaceus JB14 TaxID=1447944 RepID=A0A6A4IEW5_9AGAR|nr:hypothetical protein BT96DRAFT_962922 [Gymnopus androsaceus JB14]